MTARITQKALISRINRKLAHIGELLRRARGERWRQDLGDFYVTDENNCVTSKNIDPEEWGRELGVLLPNEHVEGSGGA